MGVATEKLQHVKDFLQDHMDMLKCARKNVLQAQDRYKKYADEHRRQVSFTEGERVYLKVPEHSTSLLTGPVRKISPRYCGPFTIVKKVGEMAYKLDLPPTSRIHPMFHVSRLKKQLKGDANIVDEGLLVELIEPPSLPHEPKRILDYHE